MSKHLTLLEIQFLLVTIFQGGFQHSSRCAREFSRLIVRFGKALPTVKLGHINKSKKNKIK